MFCKSYPLFWETQCGLNYMCRYHIFVFQNISYQVFSGNLLPSYIGFLYRYHLWTALFDRRFITDEEICIWFTFSSYIIPISVNHQLQFQVVYSGYLSIWKSFSFKTPWITYLFQYLTNAEIGAWHHLFFIRIFSWMNPEIHEIV